MNGTALSSLCDLVKNHQEPVIVVHEGTPIVLLSLDKYTKIMSERGQGVTKRDEGGLTEVNQELAILQQNHVKDAVDSQEEYDILDTQSKREGSEALNYEENSPSVSTLPV